MAKGAALKQKLYPSEELAELVGDSKLSRAEAVKKFWAYVKKHDLQDPKDRRQILADDLLQAIFGKKKIGMLQVGGLLNEHLIKE